MVKGLQMEKLENETKKGGQRIRRMGTRVRQEGGMQYSAIDSILQPIPALLNREI
jgi:hypothetical protein